MLTRLSMKLTPLAGEAPDWRHGSRLQGALLERIDPAYGDYLHRQGLHPYSQYVETTSQGPVWRLNTIGEEARREIIEPLLGGEDTFELDTGAKFIVADRSIKEVSRSSLVASFYEDNAPRSYTVAFLTPTAFRQNRRYSLWPDSRLICQSLMLKYGAATGDAGMTDDETLEELAAHTFVTRYRLRSLVFPLEGTVIPGFVGEATFRSDGTETMTRYLRLLLTFGEFSGVGIRGAMGMGAIRVRDKSRTVKAKE